MAQKNQFGVEGNLMRFHKKPEYAVVLDGLNDYFQAVNFQQWEWDQPFTFEFWGDTGLLSSQIIFTTQGQSITDVTNRYVVVSRASGLFDVQIRGLEPGASGARIFYIRLDIPNPNSLHKISIAVDRLNGVYRAVVDGLTVPFDLMLNTTTFTSFFSTNSVRVGRNIGPFTTHYNGAMRHLCFRNTVMSEAQMKANQAANFELSTSANSRFLFRPTSKHQSDLIDPTIPMVEGAQGLDMEYNGYPNPLIQGTHTQLIT